MLVRSLGWLVLLSLGVCVGCNGTEGSTEGLGVSTSSLASGSAVDSNPIAATQSTTTAPFADEVDKVRDALAAAGTDLCAVFDVTHQQLYVNPQNTAEVREAVDLLVAIIDSMRAVAPAADAAAFKEAAKRLRADAVRAEYSVEWIQEQENHTALNDPSFVAAASRLEMKYQARCKG